MTSIDISNAHEQLERIRRLEFQLDQKQKDAELAIELGQTLLKENEELANLCSNLEHQVQVLSTNLQVFQATHLKSNDPNGNTFSSSQNFLDPNQYKIASLQAENQVLTDQFQLWKKNCEEAERAYYNAAQQIEELQKLNEKLKKEINLEQDSIRNLDKILEQQKLSLSEVLQREVEYKKRLNKLENENNSIRQQLKDQDDLLVKEHQEESIHIRKIQLQKKKLEDELQSIKRENEELHDLLKDKEQLMDSVVQLLEENKRVHKDKEELRDLLDRAQLDVKELRYQIDNFTPEKFANALSNELQRVSESPIPSPSMRANRLKRNSSQIKLKALRSTISIDKQNFRKDVPDASYRNGVSHSGEADKIAARVKEFQQRSYSVRSLPRCKMSNLRSNSSPLPESNSSEQISHSLSEPDITATDSRSSLEVGEVPIEENETIKSEIEQEPPQVIRFESWSRFPIKKEDEEERQIDNDNATNQEELVNQQEVKEDPENLEEIAEVNSNSSWLRTQITWKRIGYAAVLSVICARVFKSIFLRDKSVNLNVTTNNSSIDTTTINGWLAVSEYLFWKKRSK